MPSVLSLSFNSLLLKTKFISVISNPKLPRRSIKIYFLNKFLMVHNSTEKLPCKYIHLLSVELCTIKNWLKQLIVTLFLVILNCWLRKWIFLPIHTIFETFFTLSFLLLNYITIQKLPYKRESLSHKISLSLN